MSRGDIMCMCHMVTCTHAPRRQPGMWLFVGKVVMKMFFRRNQKFLVTFAVNELLPSSHVPLSGELAIGPPTFKCINLLLAKVWFKMFFRKTVLQSQ